MILVTYSRPKEGTEILLEEQPALLMNREEARFELLYSLLMYFQDTDSNQASPRRELPSLYGMVLGSKELLSRGKHGPKCSSFVFKS